MDWKRSSVSRNILHVEQLEDRTVPSIFTPSQIQQAYGFNQIAFSTSSGRVAGNGAGETIAIVDAYDDPRIMSDLQTFDSKFGIAAPPSLTVLKQSGTVANPAWASEIALDVEWAHAMAPGARIVLGEARSENLSDLVAEVDTVAAMPNVSVVSMSWSAEEWSSESLYDYSFTTPPGHQGVTYIASAGDSGAPPSWPASSPDVLSVGGTTLYVDSNGIYQNEGGWSLSGGGISAYENKPAYQAFVSTGSSKRTNPDVAFDANPSTGLYVYNSYYNSGWVEVGGTSAGTPQWAALVAIADQGRALTGKTSLDGASQTLYAIYRMAQASESTYFHDISIGNNGYAAKAGYDYVTGNGSPVASAIVAGLLAWNGTGTTGSLGPITSELIAAKSATHPSDLVTSTKESPAMAQFLVASSEVASVPTSSPFVTATQLTFDGSSLLQTAAQLRPNPSTATPTLSFPMIDDFTVADVWEPIFIDDQRFDGSGEPTSDSGLSFLPDIKTIVDLSDNAE